MKQRLTFLRLFPILFCLLILPALACDVSSLLGDVATPTPVVIVVPGATATSAPVPTTAPTSAPTAVPTAVPVLQNIVTNGVTAKDAKGDNFDPVGITDSFGADQAIFHAIITIANAPKDTAVKAVWLTADTLTSMGEYEIKAEGSRNVDFTFKPNAGKLPAGSYKVQIYVNGKLDRTLNFSVAAGQTQIQPTTAPKPTTAAQPKPSGYVNTVTMAEGTDGDKAPINPTVIFKPSATFHAVVRTQNAPANTRYTASWFVVDVGTAAPPNSPIDQTELTTDGSRNIDFLLKPATEWPAGKYRVEISVNGVPDTVKTFSVSASSAPPPAPTAVPTKPPQTTSECGDIPAGKGGLLVVNYYGGEMNYTVGGTQYKIPANGKQVIFLPPGNTSYSANIPGVGQKTASIAIEAGKCQTQSWAN